VTIVWTSAGGTDVGRLRRGNEDNFHVDDANGLFLVADGMGGHAAGEVASELAKQTLAEVLPRVLTQDPDESAVHIALRQSVLLAHNRILQRCDEDPRKRGMGTTLTCSVLASDGRCQVAHIGDSRLYRYRGGLLEQLTHDHTWVQQEVDAGRLKPSAAPNHPLSHIVTRVLSDDVTPAVDIFTTQANAGDLLLLCSDGLYNMTPNDKISQILREPADLPDQVEMLIAAANRAGGADNITVVLIRISPA
jgi:PPM family protein phosphatase